MKFGHWIMAPRMGFEPTTPCLEGRCSIQAELPRHVLTIETRRLRIGWQRSLAKYQASGGLKILQVFPRGRR